MLRLLMLLVFGSVTLATFPPSDLDSQANHVLRLDRALEETKKHIQRHEALLSKLSTASKPTPNQFNRSSSDDETQLLDPLELDKAIEETERDIERNEDILSKVEAVICGPNGKSRHNQPLSFVIKETNMPEEMQKAALNIVKAQSNFDKMKIVANIIKREFEKLTGLKNWNCIVGNRIAYVFSQSIDTYINNNARGIRIRLFNFYTPQSKC